MKKTIVEHTQVVGSILRLKEELLKRQEYDLTAREILFKINSCLFSRYPHS